MNRRTFFEKILRNTALFTVVAGSSYLLLRKPDETAEACLIGSVCNNCKRLNSCELPQADASKKMKE